MKDEKLENSVVTLFVLGWAIRKISRDLGISRGRARRILARNTGDRDTTDTDKVPVKKRAKARLIHTRMISAFF